MWVTRVVPVPVERAWSVFTDLPSRPSWLSEVDSVEVLTSGPFGRGTTWRETRVTRDGETVTEDLVIIAHEPGRSCTMAMVGSEAGHLTYVFAPIDVGPDRGSTAVTAIAEGRPHGLADRLLSFVVGTFAARTAEGALRDELGALAAACTAGDRLDPAAA
jgi:uncharacterized membrane protein